MALPRGTASKGRGTRATGVLRKPKRAPRLLNVKGSVRSALAELVTGGKVNSKAAERAMAAIPLEKRAGYRLVEKKDFVDPRQWKTIEGVQVHVDFTRRAWLPDDWCQGLKRTNGGNTYTVFLPPQEMRTLYHHWQCEEYLGRKLSTPDGFQGQLRLARLSREQVPLSDEAFLGLLSRKEQAHLVDKNQFHFCVVSARRAHSHEGARDIAIVQTAFLSAGVTPTWYVDEGSLESYRALGLKAVVGGKLTPARNLALNDADRSRKICVQCSDDITQWEYREGKEVSSRSMDEQNAAHRRARQFFISPVAAARFILAKMRSAPEERKPRLGGAYIIGDCSRTWGGEAYSRRHFILGDFFVVDHGSKVRFDERLTLKEDYDFVAQHIHAHGSVMRCNRMTFAAKHYSNAGGAVDNRDAAGIKEQQNMAILFAKWPKAIFPHGTRKNEVCLRWPADGKASAASLEADGDMEETAAAKTVKRQIVSLDMEPTTIIVRTTKVSNKPYIAKRVRAVAGHALSQALLLSVPSPSGKRSRYTVSDLKYDMKKGFVAMQSL